MPNRGVMPFWIVLLMLILKHWLIGNIRNIIADIHIRLFDIGSFLRQSLISAQIHPYFAKVMVWKKRILGTYLEELEKRELKTLSKVLFSCSEERTFSMKIPQVFSHFGLFCLFSYLTKKLTRGSIDISFTVF